MAEKKLRVSPELALPAGEAQTQTIIVYGGKGMGKTNFAAVLAEELAHAGLRFSWLDPVGVAWGLKHSSDGRGAGVEVLVLGGTHGDLPIEPTAGEVVADLVVDEDVSVIIDISRRADGRMWTAGEKIRFVRDYFRRLYQRQGEERRPLMQILDEAGRFVPQDIPAKAIDIMECVGAIEEVVELGRNVGLGVALITQRSARMRKSVSELAELMVAFRTVGPLSLKAIENWFEDHVERARSIDLKNRIRELPRGTAMLVSPGWLGIEGEYSIRARETFDTSATPVAGKERRPRGRGAQVDHAKYRARMAETIERAEASDPRALQRQVAELRKELAAAKNARVTETQTPERIVETVEMPVEVPVVAPELVERLESAIEEFTGIQTAFLSDVANRVDAARDVAGEITFELRRIKNTKVAPAVPARRAERPPVVPVPPGERPPGRPRATPVPGGGGGSNDGSLQGPEQRILDALAWYEALGIATPSKIAVGFLSGYRVNKKLGGNYGRALGQLHADGLIVYPGAGAVTLTHQGRAVARDPGIEHTNEAFRQTIFARLDPAEVRILEHLIDAYPDPIDKVELGQLSGYRVNSKLGGNYGRALGKLRLFGLIDYPARGVAAALPVLFPEEEG